MALLPVILMSCGGTGYRKNEQISQGKRDDMQKLNKQAFELIKKGDTKTLESLLSKELIETSNTDAKVRNMGHALVVDSFVRFDEYYVKNKYLKKDTIKSQLKTSGSYSLIYPPVAQEMYFSMFIPADKQVPNQQLVTLVYAKYSYGWKICFMDMKPYGFNGKSAQELYEAAKTQYANGQLMDAVNNATLATNCMRPNEAFVYDNEAKVYSFLDKVAAEANKAYKYPIAMADVPTRPYIFSFSNKLTRQGNFPLITYITKIKLKDTAAVEKENLLIRKALSKLMPGIDKNNKFIYYLAYNQQPSAENYLERYDIRQDCW